MTASFESLTAKQQMVKLALGLLVIVPMLLIAAFARHGLMGQHFGAVAMVTILASTAVSLSSRMWIQKVK